MDLRNNTRNQHYLSQVEQRLNAINPNATPRNQRIFSFEVVNREALELRLENESGQPISKNLAFPDLFSFDIFPDKDFRMNLECLFNRYEYMVNSSTQKLLQKLKLGKDDVADEVKDLFLAKILNFIRNPFSIPKVLNTFGTFLKYIPAAPDKQILFERILNGRKPHQGHLCQELGISDSDYTDWLRLLFMLFIESGEGELNMLERIVESLFTSTTHEIIVLVSTYTRARCLVSDRAFSTNIKKQGMDGFDFNLCSQAFIRYLFADINTLAPPNTPPSFIQHYKNGLKKCHVKLLSIFE